jgi:hypothetical protein
VTCWGGYANPNPQSIPAFSGSIGGDKFCFVMATGKVRCVAAMPNQDTTAMDQDGIDDAVAVSSSSVHGCALLRDETLRCFGDNSVGQLGSGSVGGALTSVNPGLTAVRAVSAGPNKTCAIDGSGRLYCWGYLASGVSQPVPTRMFDYGAP